MEQRPEAVAPDDVEVSVGVHLVQPFAAQPTEISAAAPTRYLTSTRYNLQADVEARGRSGYDAPPMTTFFVRNLPLPYKLSTDLNEHDNFAFYDTHLVTAVILLYGRVTVWALPGVALDVVLAGQSARHQLQPLLSKPGDNNKITKRETLYSFLELTSSQGTPSHLQSCWSTCQ